MFDLSKLLLKKILKILDYIKYPEFAKIKRLTNGYLSPRIYHAIYQSALNAPEGMMIDIGPAQGASSISLGLGIRRSGKANSKVFSIEKGMGSQALPTFDDIEKNIKTLKRNIQAYNLGETCTILAGGVEEVYPKIDKNKPISLLFIDADGALDRDFEYFYNQLLPNSFLIFDDYDDVINELAKRKYLQYKSFAEIEEYVKSKGVEEFIQLCPLGKEYTTYRFIQYFLSQNLIVQDEIIGTTFFGRKVNNHQLEDFHLNDLKRIRNEIFEKYFKLNTNFNL